MALGDLFPKPQTKQSSWVLTEKDSNSHAPYSTVPYLGSPTSQGCVKMEFQTCWVCLQVGKRKTEAGNQDWSKLGFKKSIYL